MKINKKTTRAILTYTAYILVLGILQTTLPDAISILGAGPDLTLILAVLCGYMFGLRDGLTVGLAVGFFRDMLAGRVMGLGMLLLMYAGILASVAFRRFFRRNVALGIIQVFLATLIYEIVITGLTFILPLLPDVIHSMELLTRHFLDHLPGALIANGLASIPLMLLLYFAGPYRRGTYQDETDESIVGDSLWQVK